MTVLRPLDAVPQHLSATSRRKVSQYRWSRIGLLVLVVALLAGCSASSAVAKSAAHSTENATVTLGGQSIRMSRVRDASAALCRAYAEATGHPEQARALFYDRSHEVLHAIARQLEQVDRPAAARLLERMEKVEADLDSRTTGTIHADLGALAATTRAGLARVSIEVPSCA